MRFMALVRAAESGRDGPPPALIEAIVALGAEAAAAGVLVEQGGLMPSGAGGVLMRVEDGRLTITDGPFAEAREVIGGYAVYETATREEALEWSRRFMQLHIEHWPCWEGESELRQIVEPRAFPGEADAGSPSANATAQ